MIQGIPEVINNYNCYNNGDNKLIGVTGQVQLPDFNAITEEISGAGILGSYETAIPGFYSSIAQEVPFRTLDTDIFSIANPNEPVQLTFRGSEQLTNKENGSLYYKRMVITENGRLKNFKPGTLELGKPMNASVTLEVLYIKIEVDNKVVLEYDKLNTVFVLNGKDMLAEVRNYI